MIRGEADFQLVGGHQLAQACLEGAGDPATEHREAHKPAALALAMPAQVIEQLGAGLVLEGLERMGEIAACEFCFEPGDAALVDQVFHAGMAPLLAITVVPLHRRNRLHQIEHMLGRHIAQRIGGAGEGFFLVVGTAHAAAHIHIAAPQLAVGIGKGHQTNVLGEQVHRVVAGHRNGDFELARQVGGAIKGLVDITAEHAALQLALANLFHRCAGLDPVAQFTIDPEVQVGAFGSGGGEQVGDLVGEAAGGRVGALLKRGGRRHHVAVDVTAGGQGGAHGPHDRADHLLEVALTHAMHLEGLASGGPQRAVAEPVGQIIHGQKQAGGDAATGAAQPQHHLPVLLLAFLAIFAVVLLITAVEFEQLHGAITEVMGVVGQLGGQGFLQVAAVGLELFKFGALVAASQAGKGSLIAQHHRWHPYGGLR